MKSTREKQPPRKQLKTGSGHFSNLPLGRLIIPIIVKQQIFLKN